MRCTECGHEMERMEGTHRYKESGLSNVVLMNIPIWKCPNCKESEIEIPCMDALHKVLAFMVLLQPTGLLVEEIRFLRKNLGYSQEELAEKLGVSRPTVARWETNKPMKQDHDKALRRLYLDKKRDEIKALPGVNRLLSLIVDGLPIQSKKIKRRIRKEDWMRLGNNDQTCLESEALPI